MRPESLVPIHHVVRGHDRRGALVADRACGTGQFLTFLRDSQPGLRTLGIDLSLPYLAEARRRLARWPGAVLAQADAADMPLPDRSIDPVTCIFLFHELPRRIRGAVAREVARVLRPGGQLLFPDSLPIGRA